MEKGEDEMPQDQFDTMMENWLDRNNQPASDWAKPYIEAIDAGEMDRC